ncbi:MAG: hypothetical protein PCFJNLEI_02642 [Verrucomicrobiae bacterium]|nr:hypothetical protein [Verrucomicrobiae bacterium]
MALWYVLFGFFGAPRLLKFVVLWQLPKQIGRPVTLQNVRVNPFTMSVALQGFGITEKNADGKPFVSWDEVFVNVDPTGLLGKEIVFSTINISNATARVQVNPDGSFNFSDILTRFPADPNKPKESRQPPVVRVGQLRITGTKAIYDDHSRATPFHTTIGPIDVTLRDFSTAPRRHAPYAFTATTEVGETFSWRGRVHLSPVRSEGEFAVENIALKKYAPFYDEFLNLTLRSGTISIAGNYRVEFSDQLTLAQLSNATIRLNALDITEPGQTNTVMALGDLTIAGIDLDLLAQTVAVAALRTTGDRVAIYKLADGLPNVAKMLKPLPAATNSAPTKPWRVTVGEVRSDDHRATVTGYFGNETSRYERVQLTNLRIVTEPLSLTVDEILVVAPRLDVHLPADATNLFAKAGAPPTTTNAAPDKPLPFASVGAFVVSNATATFTDETVQPTAGLTVTGVAVRVTGFTTATNGLTEFAVAGRIDNTAPFSLTGHFNPFSIDATTELRVAFKNINLVPAGPYSGKFAGYLIRRGTVSIDLNYDIHQRALKAANTLLLDQFTFGEAVDSPSATKLPVKLAVAILKDRHGQIKLDVPIEGRVDDPQFRYWPAVWGVLGNMFTKIFTAPFSMLGSMFGGGGEELSYQEFAPGSAVLQSNEIKKLDVLIKALTERPALNLEITGSIDPVKDREPLKREKLKVLAGADYATGLRALYVEALPRLTPPAPPKLTSNVSNLGTKSTAPVAGTKAKRVAGDLPLEELERQYLPLVELQAEDYRRLTAARVASVVEFLKTTGQLADDRLFISTNPNAPVAKDGARVIFSLQ